MKWFVLTRVLLLSLCAVLPGSAYGEDRAELLQAMVLTGQSNHGWRASSEHHRHSLEATGLFAVDLLTSPPSGGDMSAFDPRFSAYDVIVLDFNGDDWPERVQVAFERYMANGGGLVYGHATNHTFADWPEFNEIIGIGGWGGRDEKAGPMVKYRNGKMALDYSPGFAGACVDAHEFVVVTRASDHPIMRGLPAVWLHGKDELYSDLRGPAKNMTILATAYSDPQYEAHWGVKTQGTGEHEPMAYTVRYGRGRVFGTPMGHVDGGAAADSGPWPAIDCVGFTTLLQRGAEWAATGKVTQAVPADFPTESNVTFRLRESRRTQ